jgi:hypothetical protein
VEKFGLKAKKGKALHFISQFLNDILENIKLRTGFDPATFTLPR